MTKTEKAKLFNVADIAIRESVDWSVLESIALLISEIPKDEILNEIDIYTTDEIKAGYDEEDVSFRKEELLTMVMKYCKI